MVRLPNLRQIYTKKFGKQNIFEKNFFLKKKFFQGAAGVNPCGVAWATI
jgi:hypothetical protein